MRYRGVSGIIGYAVAGLLAVIVIFFGYRLAVEAQYRLESGEKGAEKMQEMLQAAGGIADACNAWLSAGYYMYSAKDILTEFKIPEYMAPFEGLKQCCGAPLEDVAKTCAAVTESAPSSPECAGKGMISASNPAIRNCVNACTNLKNIEKLCSKVCPEKSTKCIIELIDIYGDELCNSIVTLTKEQVEDVCNR